MTTQTDELIETLIKTNADYHSAPVDLHHEIARLIKTPQIKKNRIGWIYSLNSLLPQLAIGAFIGATMATLITSQVLTGQAEKESFYLSLLADHTQAVISQRTIEVQSSNQHTVKPWLSSQLGYSPDIIDLSSQGFPLIGGRRGFIGTTPIAVAVYGYKKHEIDVYVITSEVYQKFPAKLKSKNGYNLNSWQTGDLHYVAVTDINETMLKQFSRELASQQSKL